MGHEKFISCFPGIANASGLSVENGCFVDRIGIVFVEDENVVISPDRNGGEFSSLIGIRLQFFLVGTSIVQIL